MLLTGGVVLPPLLALAIARFCQVNKITMLSNNNHPDENLNNLLTLSKKSDLTAHLIGAQNFTPADLHNSLVIVDPEDLNKKDLVEPPLVQTGYHLVFATPKQL